MFSFRCKKRCVASFGTQPIMMYGKIVGSLSKKIQGEGNTNLSHQVSDSDRDYSRESHAVQFSELDLEEEEVIEDIHFTASNAPSRQSSTLSSPP